MLQKRVSHLKITKAGADQFSVLLCDAVSFASPATKGMKADLERDPGSPQTDSSRLATGKRHQFLSSHEHLGCGGGYECLGLAWVFSQSVEVESEGGGIGLTLVMSSGSFRPAFFLVHI